MPEYRAYPRVTKFKDWHRWYIRRAATKAARRIGKGWSEDNLGAARIGTAAGCYGDCVLRTPRLLAVRADRRPAKGTAAGASRYGRGLPVGCASSQHQNEGGNQGHHHPPNDPCDPVMNVTWRRTTTTHANVTTDTRQHRTRMVAQSSRLDRTAHGASIATP